MQAMAGIAAVTRGAFRCCSNSGCPSTTSSSVGIGSCSRSNAIESRRPRVASQARIGTHVVRSSSLSSYPSRTYYKVGSGRGDFVGEETNRAVRFATSSAKGSPSSSELHSSFSKFLAGASILPTCRDAGYRGPGFWNSKFGVKLPQVHATGVSRDRGAIEGSRSVSAPAFGGEFGGKKSDVEKRKLLYGGDRPLSRNVLARSSAAASAGSYQPKPPGTRLVSAIASALAGFSLQLQRIRLGWLDLLTIMRIVFVLLASVGGFVAGKRAWAQLRQMISKKSDGEEEGAGEAGGGDPMQMLARGATCIQANMGPWSLSDFVLGLSAMAKVAEKEPPETPGQEVQDLEKDSEFLLRAQHWRSVSEAVYAPDQASFSLFSNMAESTLVGADWLPAHDSFRPAYAVFLDVPYGAVVLAVRGTSHIIDMLVNSGASAEDFGKDGGKAHGGYVHATNKLYEEVLPHIEKAFKDLGGKRNIKLVVTGHSMGAAVGALVSLKLREKYPDLECWAFCPPACVTMELAKEFKNFTTSFVAAFDIVPRFSLQSVEKLRSRIQEFNFDDVERVAKDDEDWQSMKKALVTVRKLQSTHKDAMNKMETETGNKLMEKGTQAIESDTGQQLKQMVTDVSHKISKKIDGTEEEDEKKGESEEGKPPPPPPPPLYPPGKLLILRSDPPGCGKLPEMRGGVNPQRQYGSYPTFDESKNITWRMVEAEQEDLEEIVVSPWIISDHMLGNLCEAISYFQARAEPVLQVK